jgi:hypothetical protein
VQNYTNLTSNRFRYHYCCTLVPQPQSPGVYMPASYCRCQLLALHLAPPPIPRLADFRSMSPSVHLLSHGPSIPRVCLPPSVHNKFGYLCGRYLFLGATILTMDADLPPCRQCGWCTTYSHTNMAISNLLWFNLDFLQMIIELILFVLLNQVHGCKLYWLDSSIRIQKRILLDLNDFG